MPAAHVLLVEDDQLVAEALRLLFQESGYRFSAAAGVSEGIRAARAEPPDIVLLDLTLRDGDGLEVLRTLDAEGRRPRAAVALTGHEGEDVSERCRAAGCDAVLVKPVPIRELLRRVAALVG